mgnify:CR=1 FL=1|jgi:type I restriction enzyme S subunit
MRNFCKYDQYKVLKSNILTEVPINWDMIKLKYVANIYNGNSLNDDYKLQFESENDDELPYIASKDINVETTEINYKNGTRIPKNFENLKIASKYSSLLCIEGGSAGRKMGFTNQDVYFVNKLACFNVEDEITSKFIFYILQSNHFQSQFYNAMTGLIGGVSLSNLRNFNFPLPSIQEQYSIVNFLNHQTSLIDEIINRKEKHIELLKEKRQAIINETVTKGLNPNATIKGSGIEWLGAISEDWTLTKLKYCCEFILDGTHGSFNRVDNGYRLLSVRNIINNEFVFREDDSRVSEKDYKSISSKFKIQENDIQLAIVGATLGKVAIVKKMAEEFVTQRSVATIRTKISKCIPKYLFYFMQSDLFQSYLWLNAGYSAQPGVYLGTIQNCQAPLPDTNEQSDIIAFLDNKISKIQSVQLAIILQIEKLKEYRQSIISEAVTGKIDVRDWQPNNA